MWSKFLISTKMMSCRHHKSKLPSCARSQEQLANMSSCSSDSNLSSGVSSPRSTRASSVPDDFWVHPACAIEPSNMKLSIIDQCVVRCWSSYVLSFPLGEGQSYLQIYQQLSDGLARTLAQFPFLAGRISFKDIAKGTLDLNIREDAAVRFNFRDISSYGLEFSQLEAEHFPPSVLNALDVAPLPEPYPLDGSPVFVAQANFVRGGLLLFFAHSHQVADATGTSSIMNTWAHHTAAAEQECSITISESLLEVSMDRSRLDDALANTDIPESTWATGMDKNARPSARVNAWTPGPVKNNPSTIWYVTPDALKRVKEIAYPRGGGYTSTCDALAALLWRQISKARELSRRGVGESRLYFVCDVRGRLSPPIRKDAVCNATMKMFASQSSNNFDLEMSASLRMAAVSIRAAILGFSTTRYQKWIGYLQSAPTLNSLKPREKLAGGPDMVITDHSKVSAYPLQWGPLGKIAYIRKLWWSRSEPDSQCTIMPRLPDGGMEVLTNFEEEITEKLKCDPEFLEFLEYRCQ
jgi:trichothecene 3-O-acetyltransferase